MIKFIRNKYKEIICYVILISVVLISFIVQIRNVFFKLKGFADLTNILRAGSRILNHELIYNANDFANDMPYLYAPYFAYLMGILRIIGHERIEVFVWIVFSYLLLWLALKMAGKIVTINTPSELPWFFYPALLLFCLRFFLIILHLGQVDVLLCALLLVSLYLLYQKKDVSGGALLSALTLIKTPLGIFVIFLLLEKKWKALISFIAVGFFLLLLPAVHLGWNENLFFLKAWHTTLTTKATNMITYTYRNQSIFAFYIRLTQFFSPSWEFSKLHSVSYFLSALTSSILLATSLLIYYFKSIPNHIRFCGKISCLMTLMIICSPTAWKATFIHLMLPAGFLLHVWWKNNKKGYLIPAGLFFSFLLSTLITMGILRMEFRVLMLQWSTVFFAPLVILVLLWAIPFRKEIIEKN